MPGLVNVHTHLEYTLLRGFLEDVPFFPWIRTLMTAKTRYTDTDWLVSAKLGALECIRAGITTVGDNADAGMTVRAISECGLRGRVYQEVFGIDESVSVPDTIAALDEKLQHWSPLAPERVELGVSPHAPYTVRPELLRAVAAFCETNGKLRTSIHLAESTAESDLIERGDGPFAEMFTRRGIVWSLPGVSPTRYLCDHGALSGTALAVHCIHQNAADIALIEQSGASIAHCPKSNAKLGAGIAPLSDWARTSDLSKRIGLGTDSVVSNNTLDLFEEMRLAIFLQRARQEQVVLSAQRTIEMATIGGANAMGWGDRIGSLTVGKRADMIAVRLDGLHASPATDPHAALVYSSRADDVCLTMVDGRILYDSGEFTQTDAEQVRREAATLRQRIAGDSLGLA